MHSALVASDFGLQVRRFPTADLAAVAAAPIESDGLGASLMRRECAWCKKNMGAVPCSPEQVNEVTHGICESCLEKISLPSVGGETDGAASSPAQPSPGCSALPEEKGTTARPGAAPVAALEHPSRGPAASFTFYTVTGADFGRAIKWARRQTNAVAAQIRARRGHPGCPKAIAALAAWREAGSPPRGLKAICAQYGANYYTVINRRIREEGKK